MLLVTTDRFNRSQVETLNIKERLEQPFFEHIDKVAGNTATTKAPLDLALAHHITNVLGNRQRDAACSGLERETILNVPRRFDDHGGVLRNLQANRIGRDSGRR